MHSQAESSTLNTLKKLLQTNRLIQLSELILIFLTAFAFIQIMRSWTEENLVLKQAIVWVANVIMLIMVWGGLHLRGESWKDFGS